MGYALQCRVRPNLSSRDAPDAAEKQIEEISLCRTSELKIWSLVWP